METLEDEQTASDAGGGRRRGPSAPQAVALAAAVAFFVGCVGFVVGGREAVRHNGVDVGFLRDMGVHHDQANDMSLIVLSDPTSGRGARHFATEIIMGQREENGFMRGLLAAWNVTTASLDDDPTAMGWMGDAVPADEMPGMASVDELEELEEASGATSDVLFLRLMARHHGGGVGMAEYAADRGRNGDARDLARRIGRAQRFEIQELAFVAGQVGGPTARAAVLEAGTEGLEAGPSHAHD